MHLEPFTSASHIVVDGDRRVGWTEWGPADGIPVVFCTGAAMTSSLGFGASVLGELGIRLLCVDRAGLGRSTPDPDKSFASYAADVGAVLAHLGIARAAAVGFSQGGPFAIALAAAGHVSAVALVAATDELAHPALRAHLPSDFAALLDAIAADPAGFETQFATQVDAEGMWRLVMQMSSPRDRAFYEQPDFAAAYRATLADAFSQGPAGYVRDFVLASRRWPTPPEQVRVPTSLWYGALDTSPAHSPDHGATLATRFPDARRHVLPDEGASLLWTRARDILGELLQRLPSGA